MHHSLSARRLPAMVSCDCGRVISPTQAPLSPLMTLSEDWPTMACNISRPRAQALVKSMPSARHVVIIDSHGFPLGIVDVLDVLLSRRAQIDWTALMQTCPTVDCSASIEDAMHKFGDADTAHLILTDHGRYCGIVSAAHLLRRIACEEYPAQRDANPLTGLPGNKVLTNYLNDILTGDRGVHTLSWLDFDEFKTFNDRYGFITGDRFLTEFAQLLIDARQEYGGFAAHIGGDDFFLSLPFPLAHAREKIAHLITRFSEIIVECHADFAGAWGQGVQTRWFSAALFPVTPGEAVSLKALSTALAHAKKLAKEDKVGIAVAALPSQPSSIVPLAKERPTPTLCR